MYKEKSKTQHDTSRICKEAEELDSRNSVVHEAGESTSMKSGGILELLGINCSSCRVMG